MLTQRTSGISKSTPETRAEISKPRIATHETAGRGNEALFQSMKHDIADPNESGEKIASKEGPRKGESKEWSKRFQAK